MPRLRAVDATRVGQHPWATRYVLEALRMLEEKWQHVNLTSSDQDEQAGFGMDALDVHSTRESIQSQAVEAFGPGVANFSREP